MPKLAPVVVRCAGLAAATLTLAACDITIGASEYSVREEKTFAVSGEARLVLSTFDGSIAVRGWDRNEVVVEVEKVGPDRKTVDRIQVKAAQTGNAITIDVPKPSPLETTGLRRSPSANLVVSAPLKCSVEARSGDGSLEIRRLQGTLDLDTGDGSVRAEEIAGRLVIRTGDGSVHGRAVDGRVEIRTGDGSVGLDGVLTSVAIETRDGSVEVTARPGSRADGEWDVTTGDGHVRLELPKGFSADVDARTGDGRVRVDGITPEERPGGEDERESAAGKLGGGGRPLRVRTSSGSITVKLR